jgi:hypothetical protein
VVQSLYSTDVFLEPLDVNFPKKVLVENMNQALYEPSDTGYEAIIKESLRYTDAVVSGLEPISSSLLEAVDNAVNVNHLRVTNAANLAESVMALYDEILENTFVGN